MWRGLTRLFNTASKLSKLEANLEEFNLALIDHNDKWFDSQGDKYISGDENASEDEDISDEEWQEDVNNPEVEDFSQEWVDWYYKDYTKWNVGLGLYNWENIKKQMTNLYLYNLPNDVTVEEVDELLPGAHLIEIHDDVCKAEFEEEKTALWNFDYLDGLDFYGNVLKVEVKLPPQMNDENKEIKEGKAKGEYNSEGEEGRESSESSENSESSESVSGEEEYEERDLEGEEEEEEGEEFEEGEEEERELEGEGYIPKDLEEKQVRKKRSRLGEEMAKAESKEKKLVENSLFTNYKVFHIRKDFGI